MPKEYICTVAEMRQLNPTTYRMCLEAGDLIKEQGWKPGRFVQVACGEEHFLRRPISVALGQWDEPHDTIVLVFEVRGEGTEWLSRRRVGDIVSILGFLGCGFEVDFAHRYLLVGGGIGTPPLLGCAWEKTTAVLGFRSADRVILEEEFQSRCEAVHLMTDDGSAGTKGFVHQGVEEILRRDKDFAAILACGPKIMLKSVAEVAERYGIPCQVSMEERMACGVGACLGCAIRMKGGFMVRVCKDGPVFDAKVVDWDA